MPLSKPKRTLHTGSRPRGNPKLVKVADSLFIRGKQSNRIKHHIPIFYETGRIKQPSKIMDSKSAGTRLVGRVCKSKLHISSTKSLKDSESFGSRLSKCPLFLLGKKDPALAAERLTQEDRSTRRLMSFSKEKSKLSRPRKPIAPGSGKVWNDGKTGRLSYARRLEMFQSMLEGPLSFLELHSRFGVSKQTIATFVRNGFLKEMWGVDNVGCRLRLTRKGRTYVKRIGNITKTKPREKSGVLLRLKTMKP